MGTGFPNRTGRYVLGYDAVESKNRRLSADGPPPAAQNTKVALSP